MKITSGCGLRLALCAAFALTMARVVTAQESASAETAPALEQIVVTAQKRSENVQTVPIAITAISGSTAGALGLTSTEDLTAAVPGLNFLSTSNVGTPYIRGVGNNNSSPGEESAVAIYVDGVYIPTLLGEFFSLSDVDQIEVLKGPQGTLFGRNATGGVINVTTKTPSQTPSLDVEAGYGNYNTFEDKLYGTMGVLENLAANLAVDYKDRGDGLGTDLATGQPVYRERTLSLRSKWLLTLPDTDITFAVDRNQSYTNDGTALGVVAGKLLDGSGSKGYYNVTQGNYSFGAGTDSGASLTVRHDMDWAHIVSISSYRQSIDRRVVDIGYTPDPDLLVSKINDSSGTFSQELQLLSPDSSKLKWIGGLYYFHSFAKLYGLDLTGAELAPAIFENIDDVQTTQSYATFGQVTYPVTSRLHLTGGVRYTSDTRKLTGSVATNFGVSPLVPQETKWPKVTYRGSIDFDVNDQTLVYASYSTGFKSGIYTTFTPTDPPVKPETLDAAEIGLKTEVFDNKLRFNTSAFYDRFKDMQVVIQNVFTQTLTNAGASTIKGVDFDAEFVPIRNLSISGGLSYVDAIFTEFMNCPITAPNPAGGNFTGVGDCAGRELPGTPKLTLNVGLIYKIDMARGAVTFAGNWYHNSGFYWEAEDRLRQGAYQLLNASAEWAAPNGHWGVRIWGKNLNNEKYLTFAQSSSSGDLGSPADPRTYGATLIVHVF
jgi:iron complex outermembrane receptor protein